MRSTNRHNVFPALAATALAGILASSETLTAAPAAKSEGYSPIIQAKNDYFSAKAQADILGDHPAATPGHPNHAENEHQTDLALTKMWGAVSVLAATPAKTFDEIKAKADVAQFEFVDYCKDFVMEGSSSEVRLAISIVKDLARLNRTNAFA
ncbi:hypothetical protein HK15_04475 [Acetobacter orientalis]|uniref:Uncharacterized protein n=1 Tax=Acetobacter orientalis TaxID=146474 RepID=A0A252BEC3_9PROT|nr:hypothetical protein [Acetobacter orientalis]OUJ02740.1 hypothetical protein HK15_04475 [Acetobacter orientalis]